MKTKYILLSILFSILYLPLYAANTYTIDQNSTISLTTSYVNNMSETWNVVSTVTDKPLLITYAIGTESNCDFLTINSVDNSGVATSQLLRISGSKSGTISTLVPNGRVQIVFTSDYSICYASNPSLYPGLNITFSVDNDNVINNNLHVSGKSIIDGKVGIGTMLPAKKLEIWDGNSGRFTFSAASCTSGYEIAQTIDDIGYKLNIGSSIRNYKISMNGTDKLIISSAGNIGIGTTTTPNYPLEVNGKLRVNNDIYGNKVVSFQDDARFSVTTATVPTLSTSPFSMPQYGIASPNANGSADLWLSGNNAIRIFTAGNATPRLTITNTGNVGIGTTPNSLYLLDVKGTIRATEVLVQDINQFPDFVFEENYKLLKLSEVNGFIQTNGHLPNIPSAAEVKEKGLSLVDMQVKLLQKIEELTLYAIEQQKKIEELEKRLK